MEVTSSRCSLQVFPLDGTLRSDCASSTAQHPHSKKNCLGVAGTSGCDHVIQETDMLPGLAGGSPEGRVFTYTNPQNLVSGSG